MTRFARRSVHLPGIFERLFNQLRGTEQLLVRAGDDLPLLLISFPRGTLPVAREIEAAFAHILSGLGEEIRAPYAALFESLPVMVVILLRPSNPCGCLGHHHPPGTESRLTKRLIADLGDSIGEIDLAYESIRNWRPQPLSSLAAGELGGRLPAIHFQAATLAVLLHELEHLGFPGKTEQEIRTKSNDFYSAVMGELVAGEWGAAYGMAAPAPRP